MPPSRYSFPSVRLAWLAAAVVLLGIVLLAPSGTRRILLNSLWLAGGAVAIALPLGTLLAVLLTRTRVPGRPVAAAAIGLLLLLPLFVQVSGWDAAIGRLGWHTLAFGSGARPWLSGMTAAVFLHGVAAIPWVTLIVGLGLAQVDARQEEAALLETWPLDVLLRVTLPQCWTFLVAAALWVAVATASDMTVTNIYLIDPREMTFTEQFYMNYSTAADAKQAVLAVLPALGGLLVLVLAALGIMARLASRRVLAGVQSGPHLLRLGQAWLTTWAAWLLVGVLLLVPLASLVSKAGFIVEQRGSERIHGWSAAKCVQEVTRAPREFKQEFRHTVTAAAGAAMLALAMAVVLAWPARRGDWQAAPAVAAVALALAVPGPLVGVGLMHLFNHRLPPYFPLPGGGSESWLILLYERTLVAPAVAQAVHALPLAILLVWHSLATLSDDELAAAQLDGAGLLRTFWLIVLPQRWLALAGAWLAAFAVAAGDLGWSHLVIPAGGDTIQRRVFGLVHAGVEEQVAALCLTVVVAYAVLAGAVVAILRFGLKSARR
jgi:iron(III) transport system permease protein